MINYRRVAIGSAIASATLFVGESVVIGFLGTTILAARNAAGLPAFVMRPVPMIVELVLTGTLLVWLYAVLRPLFGPGWVTAVRSGVVVWVAIPLVGSIHMIYDNFGFPASLLLLIAAGMLPVFLVAGLCGALVYRE